MPSTQSTVLLGITPGNAEMFKETQMIFQIKKHIINGLTIKIDRKSL